MDGKDLLVLPVAVKEKEAKGRSCSGTHTTQQQKKSLLCQTSVPPIRVDLSLRSSTGGFSLTRSAMVRPTITSCCSLDSLKNELVGLPDRFSLCEVLCRSPFLGGLGFLSFVYGRGFPDYRSFLLPSRDQPVLQALPLGKVTLLLTLRKVSAKSRQVLACKRGGLQKKNKR
jgi:hypothetical protein